MNDTFDKRPVIRSNWPGSHSGLFITLDNVLKTTRADPVQSLITQKKTPAPVSKSGSFLETGGHTLGWLDTDDIFLAGCIPDVGCAS
jgi:hypothetical protein